MYRFTPEAKAEMKRQMKELHDQFYLNGSKVETLSLKPSASGGKSKMPVKQVVTVPVDTTTPTLQVVDTPKVVESPKPTPKTSGEPKISKLVQTLLGTTVNSIQVVSYNASMSLPGKPQVDCICTKCSKSFTVNAYHIKYERRVDCGDHSK